MILNSCSSLSWILNCIKCDTVHASVIDIWQFCTKLALYLFGHFGGQNGKDAISHIKISYCFENFIPFRTDTSYKHSYYCSKQLKFVWFKDPCIHAFSTDWARSVHVLSWAVHGWLSLYMHGAVHTHSPVSDAGNS